MDNKKTVQKLVGLAIAMSSLTVGCGDEQELTPKVPKKKTLLEIDPSSSFSQPTTN